MGMGNLASVLTAYDGGAPVPYVQLFFDSSPDRHPAAYRLLTGFADQSSLYLWRVLGAVSIMHLYRADRPALVRLAALQDAQTSASEVLHPPDRAPAFANPPALSNAYRAGTLRPLPANAAALGLSYARSLGSLARRLEAPAGLYRGLRPAALAVLLEVAARVHALAPHSPLLSVTGAVSDVRYQALLGVPDPPAASGYTFTLARPGTAQDAVLEGVLARLEALNLVALSAYPSELEVTVASDAGRVIAYGP
jgi:hypothetical protein